MRVVSVAVGQEDPVGQLRQRVPVDGHVGVEVGQMCRLDHRGQHRHLAVSPLTPDVRTSDDEAHAPRDEHVALGRAELHAHQPCTACARPPPPRSTHVDATRGATGCRHAGRPAGGTAAGDESVRPLRPHGRDLSAGDRTSTSPEWPHSAPWRTWPPARSCSRSTTGAWTSSSCSRGSSKSTNRARTAALTS